MLKDLSRATAPGLCATCHSIDRLPTGRLLVHWQPSDRSAAPRGFTKFSHGPHVLLPELADCAACHTIHPTADSSKSYANWDPRNLRQRLPTAAKASLCDLPHHPRRRRQLPEVPQLSCEG